MANQWSNTDSGSAEPGSSENPPAVVIGAGPAGLTAARELTTHDIKPVVLEMSASVGGIARTESHNDYRFDIGGHRFFTKVKEVDDLWHEVMGEDFIRVSRLSRIYYRGKFFAYPLQLLGTLRNLGIYESVRIVLSYLKWNVFPIRDEENFEQWVINRFGRRLYLHFFKSYTEKVWGIPCTQIRADWAAQRIQNLSLVRAVLHSLTGRHDTSTLIDEFYYPRLGPGMMWQRFQQLVEDAGGEVHLRSQVISLRHDGDRVRSIGVQDDSGRRELQVSHVISSMPLSGLVLKMDPPPPPHVLDAARSLKYRDFLIVTLILQGPDPFPDNWLYVHGTDVMVGRIQNFRSWSEELVPEPDKASIGMEYFCNTDDPLWNKSDDELLAFAEDELARLGLAAGSKVVDGAVIRQEKAYPVYDEHYQDAVDVIREYLEKFPNLQSVGRNGMHRYNNQDHSMLTGLLAARNVVEKNQRDLWEVNVERSYHEEFVTDEAGDV
ncbi:MAG: NAD(P)/FAD-dependent oxidoreductase [Chromatiales bacterium]|nr:MAG: NAD(P)/FAD-dependent oxidoreductase [Chromatiales bacterium]